MAIHTFGDYVEKFHPHIHAITSDGLFAKTQTFYVMPEVDLDPLEEIFRARVFRMLKEEGKKCHPERSERVSDDLIHKLMNWTHSGFSVHNGVRVVRDDDEGREALSQYIIRNTFSLEKLRYIPVCRVGTGREETGTVIYHSKMSRGNNKKNFQLYQAEEFIAAITQHIPEKSFHLPVLRQTGMVRYYGWYSNKSRGIRKNRVSRDPPNLESSPKGEIVYEPFDDGWSGYEEPSVMVN